MRPEKDEDMLVGFSNVKAGVFQLAPAHLTSLREEHGNKTRAEVTCSLTCSSVHVIHVPCIYASGLGA